MSDDAFDVVLGRMGAELEYELAPGVYGFAREIDNALEIGSVRAEVEGAGAVGRYLDGLPTDRVVRVPFVVNPRLAGMLERRGFVRRMRYFPGVIGWGEVWVRKPLRPPP